MWEAMGTMMLDGLWTMIMGCLGLGHEAAVRISLAQDLRRATAYRWGHNEQEERWDSRLRSRSVTKHSALMDTATTTCRTCPQNLLILV